MMKTIELSGEWTVTEKGKNDRLPAVVPGCIHQDLLAAERIEDPFYADNELTSMWVGETDWVYSRSFAVPPELLNNEFVHLVCEGLDTIATVKINGRIAGKSDNAFRTWRMDVKRLLKPGENSIDVTFASTFPQIRRAMKKRRLAATGVGHHRLEGANYLRKSQCNYGWDWGPKCVTCGIWRPIRLEAYSTSRLTDITITQDHVRKGSVAVDVKIEAETWDPTSLSAEIHVSFNGERVADSAFNLVNGTGSERLRIPDAKLWWPNGLGAQPLYTVEVRLLDAQQEVLDTWERRIGLRELKLEREPDKWGESFQFTVNGKPFFAKGANWIPADTFVTRISREQYEHLIRSAADANMNMLRVWGGGIYEDDVFYDLCDEYGICVWQDFMFACSAYPAYDDDFVENTKHEGEDNVRRLRHHPSVTLWCGNNEIEQIHGSLIGDEPGDGKMTWDEYDRLFNDVIPGVVERLDPGRPYWPSSPHSSCVDRKDYNNPTCGDAHLWDVWHGRKPFEWYRTCEHRFNSEFGFQSFPEPAVVDTYAPPGERNITSYIMEHHQRSGIGNEAIVQYMLSWFRMPTGVDGTLWLSQILQGMAIKYAVEHWRRNMPQGMGTLYWQINDCWPVASWASIDYFGNWKALHYMARSFYAPVLLSAVEDAEKGTVELHVTSDLRESVEGTVKWTATTASGTELDAGTVDTKISALKNKRVATVNVKKHLETHGARDILVWAAFDRDGETLSENLAMFERPKHLLLEDPQITGEVKAGKNGTAVITVKAAKTALWVWPEVRGVRAAYSDRFFHLRAGEERTITVEPASETTADDLSDALAIRSLYDTYQE